MLVSDNQTINKIEISEFLRTVNKAINKHGITAIINTIKGMNTIEAQDNVSLIINTVCSEFGVSLEDLSSSKRGNCDNARKVCFMLLNTKLNMEQIQIAKMFQRNNNSNISRGIKEIHNLDPNLKQDKDILDKIEKILDALS